MVRDAVRRTAPHHEDQCCEPRPEERASRRTRPTTMTIKETVMDANELRAMQAPIKDRYKSEPQAAFITLKAKGTLDDANIACKVETGRALAVAGLHPATGGSGLELCSGCLLYTSDAADDLLCVDLG